MESQGNGALVVSILPYPMSNRPRFLRPLAVGVGLFVAAVQVHGLVDTALIVEAEGAALGSGFDLQTASGVTYIEPNQNFTGNFPTSSSTVAEFTVTFAKAGDYELYARVFVGPGAYSDDSLIFANDFGPTAIGSSTGWSVANGLASAGFSGAEDLVLSTGDAGTQVWKWIRVSSYTSVGVLTVPVGQLTQTYRISNREDGLRIDKLAFGPLRVTFTVNQLDDGLPGWDQRQSDNGEDYQTTGPILADGKSKFLGSVWSGTSAYNKDFEFYWDGMWHGNNGKWGVVESSRDHMNWTVLDEGYNFAKAHGVFFNFHVLLWGSQQPSWINTLSPSEQRAEIREWYEAVAARYPEIDALQVVNEPLNAPPDGTDGHANYMDALGGTGTTGFDWILEAFRLAREIFPNTPLMINEYGIEGNNALSDQYVAIIEALKAEGLIDLVGLQGHAFSTKFSSTQQLQANLEKIASTGLPIMITEMEIDGHDDFVQLAEYQRVFPIYWEHPSVIGINLSGHIGNWRADQGAVLVNDNFTERLALQWLRDYVDGAGWPDFEGFLAQRGLSSEVHSLAADVDGDGLSTGIEFLLALDPESPDRGVLSWQLSAATDSISIPLPLDLGEGRVEIQSSADLSHWRTDASYDLRFRKASGLTISTDTDRRVLHFEATASDHAPRFRRILYWSGSR